MALVGAAAITAAGALGSAAITSSQSGGGGGSRIEGQVISSPGFTLRSEQTSPGLQNTFLKARGSAAQDALKARFPRILSDLDTLRGTIRPGFSDIRKARLAAVENARSRALSNLRSNLAQRKVLGSSFGDAALIQADLAFGQEAAAQKAQSFLEEFEANRTLLGQEFSTIETDLQRELAEFQVAAGGSNALSGLLESARQFDSAQAFRSAQATANTIGAATGALANLVGGGAFGGSGGGFSQNAVDTGGGSLTNASVLAAGGG